MGTQHLKPFVKWAGGKGQILSEIEQRYPQGMGTNFTKYAEPFIGGGAVLFDVLEKFNMQAVYISDINAELVNAYVQVRDDVESVISFLQEYERIYIAGNENFRKEYYYKKRDEYNCLKHNNVKTPALAALFIFLNRTCFNGLYRVNKKGDFNVPMGSYKNPTICDADNLRNVSDALKNVTIECATYKKSDAFIDKSTVVYFDPPYRPLNATSNFTSYNENDFDDNAQTELANYILSLVNRGVYVIASNSDPKNTDENDCFFDKLYEPLEIERISASRMINSIATSRGKITELLIHSKETSMNELESFASRFATICGKDPSSLSIDAARNIIKEINEFLYSTDYELGTIDVLDTELPYFSEFHKYWESYHREILNLTIDNHACETVADALHDVYIKTNGRAFSEVWDTCGLSNEDVCRVRILSANQDFRGSRKFSELAGFFRDDNTIFDEKRILNDPEDFVRAIGITSLSQNDKRTQYARGISQFLIDNNASPFEIIDRYERNVFNLRNALINYPSAGYGNKKADMFIRDMVVLGIWDNISGFEQIDVASDVNTIKVALRTGILKSAIPLVSSFLDIFSYQYAYVDELNAAAWRNVWSIWKNKYPEETISSPCLLDFFVYNVVGRQFCKETLCIFQCETGAHQFKWHSGRNKTCQVCYRNGIHNHAKVIKKVMPCTDVEGEIAIRETEFYRSGIASPNIERCPFYEACHANDFKMLTPPKSISILGQTGWSTAYSKKGQGGGGIMA